jgi:uncharacterized protein (TIGR03067 family)
MRTLISASVFCLAILAGAQTDNQDAVQKEVGRLRGTWTLDTRVWADQVKAQFAIYGDESFEINLAGNHINGERKIDPTKNPKQITLTLDNSKKSLFGIYKLEGDALTICFGEKRPTAFKAREGATLWVLKREKREKK